MLFPIIRVLALTLALYASSIPGAQRLRYLVFPTDLANSSSHLKPQYTAAPSLSSALKTMTEDLRAAKLPADVEIVLASGTHRLEKTVEIDGRSFGGMLRSLIIRSESSWKARISGGKVVGMLRGRTGTGEAVRFALSATAGGVSAVYACKHRLVEARHPNARGGHPFQDNWLYARGPRLSRYSKSSEHSSTVIPIEAADHIAVKGGDEGFVFVYPRYSWRNDVLPVQPGQPATDILKLAAPATYDVRPGDRYFRFGSRSYLDFPGEWHWDSAKGELWVMPTEQDCELTIPTVDVLLRVKNIRNVHFRGLLLTHASEKAIHLTDCIRCSVVKNEIFQVGTKVKKWSYAIDSIGGSDVTIADNSVVEVGGGAIRANAGNMTIPSGARYSIQGNRVAFPGLWDRAAPAIYVEGVGVKVDNNRISDTPRTGILVGGVEHQIRRNVLKRTVLETDDGAAIYISGRNGLTGRGVSVSDNLVCAIGETSSTSTEDSNAGNFGIYLDDSASGVEVVNNTIKGNGNAAIYIHNGANNLVTKNHVTTLGAAGILVVADRLRYDYLEQTRQGLKFAEQNIGWLKYAGMRDDIELKEIAPRNNQVVGNVVYRMQDDLPALRIVGSGEIVANANQSCSPGFGGAASFEGKCKTVGEKVWATCNHPD